MTQPMCKPTYKNNKTKITSKVIGFIPFPYFHIFYIWLESQTFTLQNDVKIVWVIYRIFNIIRQHSLIILITSDPVIQTDCEYFLLI